MASTVTRVIFSGAGGGGIQLRTLTGAADLTVGAALEGALLGAADLGGGVPEDDLLTGLLLTQTSALASTVGCLVLW